MPVVVDPRLKDQVQRQAQPFATPEPRPEVSLTDQLGAAFDLDNVIESAREYAKDIVPLPDPFFDPVAHLTPFENLNAARYADAQSLGELQQIRGRVKREGNARRLLEDGPLPALLASSIAILLDPTTFIPVAGGLAKASAGARVATRAARVGAAAAIETAGGEAILQATQETRTMSETMAAVLLGGAFGVGIGAAVGRTAAKNEKAVQGMLDDATQDVVAVGEAMMSPIAPESAGSATARMAAEETELAGGAIVSGFARALGRIRGFAAPSLELITSKIPAAREAVLRLVDTGMTTKGQVAGIYTPAALETRIKGHEAVIASSFQFVDNAWRQFRKGGGKMTYDEFRRRVGRAMRRGDTDPIPAIQEVAQEMRHKVFEPYKNKAVRLGLLPEDVDVLGAASYFTRMYKREALQTATGRAKFRRIVVDHWKSQARTKDFVNEAEMFSEADRIIDTILGSPSSRVPLVGSPPAARGPMKERTFDIPDEMIEEFLEDDILTVSARYVRTMAADTETKDLLGATNADDLVAKIRDEAIAEAETLRAAGKTKQADRLLREAEVQGSLVHELLAEIRGVRRGPTDPRYQMARRVAKTARDLNYMRLMGSVLISSLPDIGRVVMEEGLTRSFGTLLADTMSGFKGVRLAVGEAQAAGTALDLINGQRAAAMFDTSDRFLATTKFERGMDTASNLYGLLTLLDPWNASLKGWTSLVAGSRILKTCKAVAEGRRVSKRDITKLAKSGINPDMAKRIAAEEGNWITDRAAYLPNTTEWADNEARAIFRDALLADVDRTIITPGAGDAPLWTSTDWGRTIFQFKRFAMASTQKILIAGLQARDAEALNGVIMMMALGAFGTAIRDMTFEAKGKPLGEVKDRTPAQWVADGIDRSGTASMFFELNNMVEKVAGMSAVSAITGKEVSRFANRDVLSQVFGPTAGLAEDTASAVTNALRDDFTRPDLHRVRKLFPAQNLFYLRGYLDLMERATGLPERQPR